MLVVNQLIGFGTRRRVAPPSGGGYSFTMTAADYFGAYAGYDTGWILDVFGSINAEPIPSHDLAWFIVGGGINAIGFVGDATSLLTGLTVWVDSVQYAANFSGWSYDAGDGSTLGEWSSGAPVFADGVNYLIEIK